MRFFGKSNAMGRRSVPRTRAPVIAVLTSTRGEYFASVTDVSRTGARVEAEVLPPLGEQLTFRALEVQVRGGVVRREGLSCAIDFEMPIAASEVQRLQFHHCGQP